MTFRANADSESGRKEAMDHFIGREIPREQREQSRNDFADLINQYGPVVTSYPSWHPLVACGNEGRSPWTTPNENRGYLGLDHTVLLRDAFITCPYGGVDKILKSVEEMNARDPHLSLEAEELDMTLYHPMAKPVLIKYDWGRILNPDGTIPKSLVVPLLLEFEIPAWRTAQVAETWETMRTYILGQPSGQLSSLFVNKETGTLLKKIWNNLIYSGMYGPIKV
jgi:hypothetical protein